MMVGLIVGIVGVIIAAIVLYSIYGMLTHG